MEKITIQKYNELRSILEKQDELYSIQLDKYKLLESAISKNEINFYCQSLTGGIASLLIAGHIYNTMNVSEFVMKTGVTLSSILGFIFSFNLADKLNKANIKKARELFADRYPNDIHLLELTESELIHENVVTTYLYFENIKALSKLDNLVKLDNPKINLNENYRYLKQQLEEFKTMLTKLPNYDEIHLDDRKILQEIEPVKIKK